jgi:hypothetical protein
MSTHSSEKEKAYGAMHKTNSPADEKAPAPVLRAAASEITTWSLLLGLAICMGECGRG